MRTWVMVNSFLICQSREQLITTPRMEATLSVMAVGSETSIQAKALLPAWVFFMRWVPHVSLAHTSYCPSTLPGPSARPQTPTALWEFPAAAKQVYSWNFRSSGYRAISLPLFMSRVVPFHCFSKPFPTSKGQLSLFRFTHLFIQQLVMSSLSTSI